MNIDLVNYTLSEFYVTKTHDRQGVTRLSARNLKKTEGRQHLRHDLVDKDTPAQHFSNFKVLFFCICSHTLPHCLLSYKRSR